MKRERSSNPRQRRERRTSICKCTASNEHLIDQTNKRLASEYDKFLRRPPGDPFVGASSDRTPIQRSILDRLGDMLRP